VYFPMDGGPFSVLLVLAAGAVDGMSQSLLTGRTRSSAGAVYCAPLQEHGYAFRRLFCSSQYSRSISQ
jgi:hypothetical protein